MNEVLVGAALPLVVWFGVYAARGLRAGWKTLVFGPIAMLISGAIAVIPDMPRALGDIDRYHRWHASSWCNLCWGHCWIDARPGIDDWVGWPLVAIGTGALVLGVAYRELRRAETS